MKKEKLYKYLGRNGILLTRIILDGISHIPMLSLQADEGKILTDGENRVYSVTIEEQDLSLWKEIPDSINK